MLRQVLRKVLLLTVNTGDDRLLKFSMISDMVNSRNVTFFRISKVLNGSIMLLKDTPAAANATVSSWTCAVRSNFYELFHQFYLVYDSFIARGIVTIVELSSIRIDINRFYDPIVRTTSTVGHPNIAVINNDVLRGKIKFVNHLRL